MRRIYLLVEGQTEESFVNELLRPHYDRLGLFLTAIVVRTSPGYKGGVVRYAKIKPQLEKLCRQQSGAHVTTLFDLYALPGDFPGKNSSRYQGLRGGQAKARFLEAELARDMVLPNFIPHLLVHEFEALLFSQLDAFTQWTDDDRVLMPLRAVRSTASPEDINDGPLTAPSKRILAAMPGYQKTFHGPLIACDIGLDTMRRQCPHFDAWLQKIEALA